MTVQLQQRALFEAARIAAFGSVAASYTALGGTTLHAAWALYLVNSLDTPVIISFDGTTDHVFLGTGQTLSMEFGSAKQGTGKLFLPKGTIIYQKRGGGAPSSGNVAVSLLYGG